MDGRGKATASDLVDLGAPLGETASIGAKAASGHIAGYSPVRAKSIDAAKMLFDGRPHMEGPGFSIELLEALPTP